jgi:hypothetical protein
MMGEERKTSAVTSAAPSAGASRIVAGTIGEAAAIARRAATGGEPMPVFAAVADSLSDRHQTVPPSKVEAPAEVAPDPLLTRRTKAGAGHLKDSGQGENPSAAVHLILADRAYAYGQHIVAKDKGTKLGDVLAIDS